MSKMHQSWINTLWRSMISRKQRNIFISFVAAMVVLPWGFIQPRALEDIRNFAFDAFQRQSPRIYDPQLPVRIIGIDEESLAIYGQWPWPRTRLAELTKHLNRLGAAAIVFDMIFAEQDRASIKFYIDSLSEPKVRKRFEELATFIPNGDNDFVVAMNKSSVVLGAVASESASRTEPPKAGFVTLGDDPAPFLIAFNGMIAPFNEFYAASAGVGATNWLPDHDQVVRRIPLLFRSGHEYVPSLALEAIRVAQGAQTYVVKSSNASGQIAFGVNSGVNTIKIGGIEIPTGSAADIRPRYSHADINRSISAKSIFEGKIDRSQIEGRIIFVGARAVGLGDFRATPLEPAVPGVDVHAQLVESILSDALLSRPDWALGLELIISAFSFLLTMVVLFFASPFLAAVCGPALVLIFIIGSYSLYELKGLLIDPIYPSSVVLGGYLVGSVALWRAERIAREEVSRAFGKFVAPAVVQRIAENPERLVLGGETKEISILFCDLRNFSTISAGLSAADLTKFMNSYFTPLTDAVINSEGTIDKYIGDAILAFWNAPLDIADHRLKSANAALMMRDELMIFNEKRTLNGESPIAFGIGLHSGNCSVGNMGSDRRFDYSILGDAVNLTSRLEGVCKIVDTDILSTREFREATSELAWLDLGLIKVVGRSEATNVFALAGDNEMLTSAFFGEWQKYHERMMLLYRSHNFSEAEKEALLISETVPYKWQPLYQSFQRRCNLLSISSVATDEEPVWILSSK